MLDNKLVLGAIVCATGAAAAVVGIAVTVLATLLTK